MCFSTNGRTPISVKYNERSPRCPAAQSIHSCGLHDPLALETGFAGFEKIVFRVLASGIERVSGRVMAVSLDSVRTGRQKEG